MYFPLSVKNFLLLSALIMALGGCKTSPAGDNSSFDTTPLTTAPISNAESALSVDQVEPVSGTLYFGRYHLFPRQTNGWDESGWSILTPSLDSRLMYVSSSEGNDDAAAFVEASNGIDFDNPGPIKPFKTIEAALDHARDGFPDWVLLKRGDEWAVDNDVYIRAGRGVYERSVITSYGASGERPVLKMQSKKAFRIWAGVNYVALMGLSLIAEQRDPSALGFLGWGEVDDQTGILVHQPEGELKKSILIENNDINYFSGGIIITGAGHVDDVVIRRNIVRNSYSELAHSQGLYAARASILLEENIFDHNGWFSKQIDGRNSQDYGQATIFNHNTYLDAAVHTHFLKNIFLRSSSMQNKWTANSDKNGSTDSIKSHNLWLEGNVYVGGEIGISAGGNTDYDTGPRWENVHIIDNILLAIGRDQPTNRDLGWYITASDWKTGLICGNYLLNNDNPLVTNLSGINVSGHSSGVTVAENTFHGLLKDKPGTNTGAITVHTEGKSEINIDGNNIQLGGSNMRVLVTHNTSNIKFQNNRYFSGAESDVWFRENDIDRDFESWVEMVGDLNSVVQQDSFSEPRRSFETYLSLIGASGSVDNFIKLAVSQSKNEWSRDLTADAISNYIRDGYGGLRCSLD